MCYLFLYVIKQRKWKGVGAYLSIQKESDWLFETRFFLEKLIVLCKTSFSPFVKATNYIMFTGVTVWWEYADSIIK